jgi:asparagine synthase (glutamine-hydrolysing)
MFRYMTFISDLACRPQSDAVTALSRRLLASSPKWRIAFDRDGMLVLCADIRSGSLEPHPLARDAGVVVGTLFERHPDPQDDTPPARAKLDERETVRILKSQGRELIDRYWGNYVAFICDPTSHTRWVIKDPTGFLPCFRTTFAGVTIIFSCVTDCLALDLSFEVNWSFVRSQVISTQLDVEEPPLVGVSEVFRGECVRISSDLSSHRTSNSFYWTPLSFSGADSQITDLEQAARALRATVIACTRVWATCHASILHRLSGGLDSSVVLSCFKERPTISKISCWTYFLTTGLADPRYWARLAARDVDCDHFELPEAGAVRLDAMTRCMPSIIPRGCVSQVVHGAVIRRLASERSATALFSGDGGDAIFGSAIKFVVDEYLYRCGLRPAAVRLAVEVARYADQTVWKVLAKSISRWLRGHYDMTDRRAALQPRCALLHPDIRGMLLRRKEYPHPWFRAAEGPPWRTILKLGILTGTPEFYDVSSTPDAPDPEPVFPLYSQPIVEISQRIPGDVLFADGCERGLARRAFAGQVPDEILRRQWKDRAPGWGEQVLHDNLPFLREMLLDGMLVNERLLDRATLERVLSGGVARGNFGQYSVLNFLELENWLRQWTGNRAHSAI